MRITSQALPKIILVAFFWLTLFGLYQNFISDFNIINVAHAEDAAGDGDVAIDPGSCSSDKVGKLCNPLKATTISEFLLAIVGVLLMFAVPIVVIYIMYAGFLFVTARGNTEQISTARTALLWAVVGGVVVIGARVIISVIQGTIADFGPP